MELYSFPINQWEHLWGNRFRFPVEMVPAGTSAGGFWENLRRPSMLSTSLSSGVCPGPVARQLREVLEKCGKALGKRNFSPKT